jgi:hypothetical protein
MTDTIDRDAARRVLDLPLPDNDAGVATIRDYLTRLLTEVWREEQGFSGKRPFGNSGWQHEVYVPMIRAGLVPGSITEWDEVDGDFDYRDADRLILAAIADLGRPA